MQLSAEPRRIGLVIGVLRVGVEQIPDVPLGGVEGRRDAGAGELSQIERVTFELDDRRIAVPGLQALDAALLQNQKGAGFVLDQLTAFSQEGRAFAKDATVID